MPPVFDFTPLLETVTAERFGAALEIIVSRVEPAFQDQGRLIAPYAPAEHYQHVRAVLGLGRAGKDKRRCKRKDREKQRVSKGEQERPRAYKAAFRTALSQSGQEQPHKEEGQTDDRGHHHAEAARGASHCKQCIRCEQEPGNYEQRTR